MDGDDGYKFMDCLDDAKQGMDEVDILRLLLQTVESDLSEVLASLERMQDRWKYYQEPPTWETIEDLTAKMRRMQRSLL